MVSNTKLKMRSFAKPDITASPKTQEIIMNSKFIRFSKRCSLPFVDKSCPWIQLMPAMPLVHQRITSSYAIPQQ